MNRLLTSAALILALVAPASAQPLTFKVLGQPVSTGKIYDELEKPFFENLGKETGIDATATFSPVDTTGIKDNEGLRIAKGGLFDIVSLRFSPISRDAPAALGLDLVGQNADYASARRSAELYLPEVQKVFAEQFDTKLLGIWPFGPQILFCKPQITSLADIKGLKVRVFDQSLANFVSSLGGTPVPLPFSETQQSLQRGVVDCAVTGPSSANAAAWPEVTTTVMPLGFNVAFNGYGMNMKRWNALTPEQQDKVQAAFTRLTESIWTRSEQLYTEALRCNTGQQPCDGLRSYDLKIVEPTAADLDTVANALKTISFPVWKEICDAATPGCSDAWLSTIGADRGF